MKNNILRYASITDLFQGISLESILESSQIASPNTSVDLRRALTVVLIDGASLYSIYRR